MSNLCLHAGRVKAFFISMLCLAGIVGPFARPLLAQTDEITGADVTGSPCSFMVPDKGFIETMLADAGTEVIERRVAFVLGNGDYAQEIGPLQNPIADAEAMAQRLQFLGFEVFMAINATQAKTQRCFERVLDSMAGADLGLFFYAGHGVQVDDRNYAVAVDAEVDLESLMGLVSVERIIDGFRKTAKWSVFVLDACRTTPWTDRGSAGLSVGTVGRSLSRGGRIFEEADTNTREAGIYLAYATSPNSIAADGTGKHSPFSTALLEYLGIPGYSLDRVMAGVKNRVGEATDWSQTPWTRSSLPAPVFLNGQLTLEDTVAASEKLAREARRLAARGKFHDALVAALKGLPASLGDEELTRTFRAGHDALSNALRQRPVVLPLSGQNPSKISADGRYVLAASSLAVNILGRQITVWDTSTGKEVAEIGRGGKQGGITNWDVSKDSKTVATFSADGKIELWTIASGRLLHRWVGHRSDVLNSINGNIAFGPSDAYLVSVGSGDVVKLWNARGHLIRKYSPGRASRNSRITNLGFSPDKIMRNAEQSVSRMLSYPQISPDGRFAAAATTTKIVLWELKSGELHKELLGPEGWSAKNLGGVTWFGFDRAGKRVASFSSTKKVWLWSAQTGELLFEWPYDGMIWGASISPDGRIVAVRTVNGWEYRSGDTGEIVPNPVQEILAGRVMMSPGGEVLGELHSPGFAAWEKGTTGKRLLAMALSELGEDMRAEVAREQLRYWPLADVGNP